MICNMNGKKIVKGNEIVSSYFGSTWLNQKLELDDRTKAKPKSTKQNRVRNNRVLYIIIYDIQSQADVL